MTVSKCLLPFFLAAVALAASQAIFSGCAIPGDSSPQAIARWKNMPKVHVFLDGLPIGVTPVIARVNRGQTHRLRIEMAGHDPLEIPIRIPSEKAPAESPWDDSGILVNIMVNGMTGVVQRYDQPGRARRPGNGRTDALHPRDVLEVCTTVAPDPDAKGIGHLRRR